MAESLQSIVRTCMAHPKFSLTQRSTETNHQLTLIIPFRKGQFHRNFGKLHTAQNKMDEALDDLCKDIYCSSLEVGPEHIDTSAGYFLIANIFYAQRKVSLRLRSEAMLPANSKLRGGACEVCSWQ